MFLLGVGHLFICSPEVDVPLPESPPITGWRNRPIPWLSSWIITPEVYVPLPESLPKTGWRNRPIPGLAPG